MVGLLVFQGAVQTVAWGVDRLQGLQATPPLTPEAMQSILILCLAVVAVVAVAACAWLGRQSRRQGEGVGWLVWVSLAPALVAMALALLFRNMGVWDYERYPASLIVWMYVDRTLEGLILCSAAAAISVRLWAVIALAFHAYMAASHADFVSLTAPSAAAYRWDRSPEAIAALLHQISAVSLCLMLVAIAAVVWNMVRRRAVAGPGAA
jgi:hypothetical protein